MAKAAYFTVAVMTMFFVAPLNAQTDDEEEVYKTQVPTGMELYQVGKKPAYKIVLPKGTTIRREGDLKIVEGTGEYVSRKFVEYDDLLDKMNAETVSLRKDVEEIKKTVSEMQKGKLASK